MSIRIVEVGRGRPDRSSKSADSLVSPREFSAIRAGRRCVATTDRDVSVPVGTRVARRERGGSRKWLEKVSEQAAPTPKSR